MAVMRNYYPRLTEYIWLKRRRFMFLQYVLLSAGGKIMFAVWVGDSVLYYWKAGLFLPLREISERLDVWGQKSDWCASGSSKPVWGAESVPGGFDSHMSPPEKKQEDCREKHNDREETCG